MSFVYFVSKRILTVLCFNVAVLKYMAQDGCDRKEAQGNMDAFLENPQGEFALILLSQHIFSLTVALTLDNLLQKFRLGISKSIGAKRSL